MRSTTIRSRALAASFVAVLALGGLAACASDSDSSSSDTTTGGDELVVTDAWARESAMSTGNGAVYLTITNGTGEDDALTAASVPSDIAAEAQVHETLTASGDMSSDSSEDTPMDDMGSDTTMGGGMMSMQEVGSVPVPAGSTVSFEPGGYHVMLMELAAPLEVGQTFPVTLTFENAGEITVTATVRAS
jgi:copper(I)-binding protein